MGGGDCERSLGSERGIVSCKGWRCGWDDGWRGLEGCGRIVERRMERLGNMFRGGRFWGECEWSSEVLGSV